MIVVGLLVIMIIYFTFPSLPSLWLVCARACVYGVGVGWELDGGGGLLHILRLNSERNAVYARKLLPLRQAKLVIAFFLAVASAKYAQGRGYGLYSRVQWPGSRYICHEHH